MKILTPEAPSPQTFTDATAAVDCLTALYTQATTFLRDHFNAAMQQTPCATRIRAFYPEVRFSTSSYASVDSRLSFGHVSSPGSFAATITRPDLTRQFPCISPSPATTP